MMNLPQAPGVYSLPENRATPEPVLGGTVYRRDVGNYRLCTVTAADGKVTNWQRELPDGKWRKVQGVS